MQHWFGNFLKINHQRPETTSNSCKLTLMVLSNLLCLCLSNQLQDLQVEKDGPMYLFM